MGWMHGVIIGIDQLGNAIFAGNPDSTISSRVGYFAQREGAANKRYWQCLEMLINFTFYPLDGRQHCLRAYKKDPDENFKEGNKISRSLLAIVLILPCMIIGISLRIMNWLPFWQSKDEKRKTDKANSQA